MEMNCEVERIEHKQVEKGEEEVKTGKVVFSNEKGERFVYEGEESITQSYVIGEKITVKITKQNKTIAEAVGKEGKK